MSRSVVRQVLAGLGVVACVAGMSAVQEPQSPAPEANSSPVKLAGSWEYSEDASKEDPRNWRRPVGSTQPLANPGGFPAGGPDGGGRRPAGDPGWGGGGGFIPRPASAQFEGDLRRALRDLLEVAETFDIVLKPDQVVITDDLDRTLTFSTTGKKEKHRIGATNFETKTVWEGAILKQDIEAIGGFHMTQVYFPSADGQTLFVSMTVDKPEFKPPIKPITRTYRRVN